MRKMWTMCVAGAAAVGLVGWAAMDLLAAADEAPIPVSNAPQGVWGLLEELVRTPTHLREDRADRIAGALRADRSHPGPDPAPRIPTIEPIAPAAGWEVPTFELTDAESSNGPATPDDDGLDTLLETYRTLSPAMKERLRGMRDAEMVQTVERLALAERELQSALDSK